MKYFVLEPEVAGGLGENVTGDFSIHPPKIQSLHYEFNGWLGDDIVETFPCYLVTEKLGEALEKSGFTGFALKDVEVSVSDTFNDFHRDIELPKFLWLKVNGKLTTDDFWLSDAAQIVVSENVFKLMEQFQINNCEYFELESLQKHQVDAFYSAVLV